VREGTPRTGGALRKYRQGSCSTAAPETGEVDMQVFALLTASLGCCAGAQFFWECTGTSVCAGVYGFSCAGVRQSDILVKKFVNFPDIHAPNSDDLDFNPSASHDVSIHHSWFSLQHFAIVVGACYRHGGQAECFADVESWSSFHPTAQNEFGLVLSNGCCFTECDTCAAN